ncbi:Fic family protein [Brachybacterium kimchii]|uniref:Fic family protein n=1 Tax=Brachybacterium kimchii TaxID=2942909 RepID=A0ABY4N410_9MICO|nr:Fic family protein [Brachybacterium kimchii]UQN28884.1 Fic family protein [Brachybacterium kimchii]
MTAPTPGRIPSHRSEERPWSQRQRGGTREDRMMDRVITRIPPRLADLDVGVTSATARAMERALEAIVRTDQSAGAEAPALARFMIRNESIASSRIEHVSASGADLARALVGSRANASARSMVAASRALHEMLLAAGRAGALTIDDLQNAHRLLMQDDDSLGDREWAGRVREEQNWIGGSDHSPRGALFVPPPPDLIDRLLVDLEAFLARDDLPVLLQATIAHGQFESIHPFTDGNGRIGRALIAGILQRRGVTRNAAVPVASGLYALREQYFAALGAYREGDLGPLVDVLCRSAEAAATEARVSFERLREMPDAWHEEIPGRGGSALARLLGILFAHPTFTVDEAREALGASTAALYPAVETLESAGILREVTGRKRERIWVVADVVDELEDLDRRVAIRAGGAAHT